MKTFFISFWTYTRNPFLEIRRNVYPIKTKIKDCVLGIIVYLLAATILSSLTAIPVKWVEHFYSIDLLAVRDQNIGSLVKGAYLFFIIALLGPLVEETLFRLGLSFEKWHLALAATGIAFVLLSKIDHGTIYAAKTNAIILVRVGWALLIGASAFLLFSFLSFENLPAKYFRLFYWGSCLAFGLVHIFNFAPLKLSIGWVYPFLVLPQLALGFILGYIRMKNGFFWALIMHCLINIPGALLFYLK